MRLMMLVSLRYYCNMRKVKILGVFRSLPYHLPHTFNIDSPESRDLVHISSPLRTQRHLVKLSTSQFFSSFRGLDHRLVSTSLLFSISYPVS